MKVPLSWLGDLVELSMPVPELARRLTMAGLEVEDVHVVGSNWSAVSTRVSSLPFLTSSKEILAGAVLRIRMPRWARCVMPCGAAKPAANFVGSSAIGYTDVHGMSLEFCTHPVEGSFTFGISSYERMAVAIRSERSPGTTPCQKR